MPLSSHTRFDAALSFAAESVERTMERLLPSGASGEARVFEAMRYSSLGGGKRLRAFFVLAGATLFKVGTLPALRTASAIEFVHAYSLIHDDLPAMDDDDLRRGKPSCHRQFDEATAILAGDALQALAFEVLAGAPQDPRQRVAMLAELARAAGAAGMCGGQALDIDATGQAAKRGQGHVSLEENDSARHPDRQHDPGPFSFSLADLERLHALKTGALLRASVRLGAIAAGADAGSRAALDRYADALGLAFQVRDDLLDIEGDAATLGKTAGKDLAQAKATFPALLGIEASRGRLQSLSATMQEELRALPTDGTWLAALARKVVERSH